MPTVVLLGTLDTKGLEYAFLRDRVREHDVDVLLLDAGILGEPLTTPDISRDEIAEAGGVEVAGLAAEGDRGAAITAMARGAAEVVAGCMPRGGSTAILGLGGSGNSTIIAARRCARCRSACRSCSSRRSPPVTRGRTSARSTSR